MKVAVVGGGISGLVAAYELKEAGVEVTLYEKENIVGSSLRTTELAGQPLVEEGADAFLTRSSAGCDLCEKLGIDLTAPAAAKVLIENSGELVPPLGPHILGVPLDPEAAPNPEIASSLKADFTRTEIAEPPLAEETLGSMVRRRIGSEIYERQVAPLLGAISASNPDLLSLEVASPILADAREASPSLIKGLKKVLKSRRDIPPFYAPIKGMGEIPVRLQEELANDVRLGAEITNLDDISADAFILAAPAYVSSQLVKASAPAAADILAEIEYASVCLAQLIYEGEAIPESFSDLSGILLPSADITAVSFATQKWKHYLIDENLALLRVSVGRYNQNQISQISDEIETQATEQSDHDILALIQHELSSRLKIKSPPKWSRISRWHKSFPQYFPGHKEKIAAAEDVLAEQNIYLAGSTLAGVGIPACIETGIRAAGNALSHS